MKFLLDARFRLVAEDVACCEHVFLLSGVNVERVLWLSSIGNIWIVAFTDKHLRLLTFSEFCLALQISFNIYYLRVLFGSTNIVKYLLSQSSVWLYKYHLICK
jgi:hypothetical protein